MREHIDPYGYNFRICSYPGTGMVMSVTRCLGAIRQWNPHLITLAASICDVTKMDIHNRKISLRYTEVDEAVKYFMRQLNEAIQIINILHPEIVIQVTTLIGADLTNANFRRYKHLSGLDLENYNKAKVEDINQHIMNEIVLAINREIVMLNTSNSIPTAWTSNCIHSYKHGTYYHRYSRLSDGCHYTGRIKEDWAKLLCASYAKMTRVTFKY